MPHNSPQIFFADHVGTTEKNDEIEIMEEIPLHDRGIHSTRSTTTLFFNFIIISWMRIRRGEMYKNEMLKERKKKLNYANRALCRWLAGPV